MAEIPNAPPSNRIYSCSLNMNSPIQDNVSEEFVAVDIGHVYLMEESNSSPRFTKGFSRKGVAAEKKAAEGEAAATGGAHSIAVAGHVAVIEEAGPVLAVSTPTGSGGGKMMRRVGSSGRRPQPPWRDPRKVMVFFAAMSCVGTLVLLYFTLSLGKSEPQR